MSSFYGGKQGRTYNIVQRYSSVQQMCEAFAGGGAYTDANYGQYVIIDTVLNSGRSNKENGLLYRRGFDYNQTIQPIPIKQNNQTDEQFAARWVEYVLHPGAGAIYVGQIVGPEGRTPQLNIEQWSDFQAQSTASGTGAFGSTSSIILEQTTTGKEDDYIKAGYINIRDSHGDTTGGYISIDIPKHVQQAEVVNHGAYATAGVTEASASTAHPLWYKWNFTIPDGKHGDDVHDIKIETGNQTGAELDGFGNPMVSEDKYFTYSIQDYNTRGEDDYTAAEVITEHLGRWPYRVIDGITLTGSTRNLVNWEHLTHVEVGDLYRTNNYAPNMYWVCLKAGRIINSNTPGVDSDGIPYEAAHDSVPSLTSENQVGTIVSSLQETKWRAINIPQAAPAHSITVAYTAGENDNFDRVLRSVDHLSVDDTGNLYAFYSDNIEESYYLTNIGGLKTGDDGQDRGVILTDDSIQFIYTNGSILTYPLKQILSIDFYTGTPQRDLEGQWAYDEQGKPIFNNYTQDSNLKIRYKDGTYDTFEVKRIDKIVYNNGNINTSQHIKVQYLGGQQVNVTDVPVNMVRAIGRKGDNILVLYSDPQIRNQIPQDKQVIIPSWTDPSTGDIYNNLIWYNFGPLGAQYHIQGEYSLADLKGDDTDPDFTIDLSEGFTGDLEDRMGWLVTLTDDQDKKHLYAFDYNDNLSNPSHELYDGTPSCWYEIMELSAQMINPNRVVAISPASTAPSTLVDGGLWFVVSYGHDQNI